MMLQFTKLLNPSDRRASIIVDAIGTIVENYSVKSTTSVSAPPRFGKSSIIRLSALEINAITKMPSVMLAPFEDNVDQIRDVVKIEQMYTAYGTPTGTPFTSHRCTALPTHEWWKLVRGGAPTFITATIGLINHAANQQQFLDGLADMYQRCGKRIAVFIDECQYVRDRKAWGQLIRKIIEAGGYIVLLTGTPVPGIPGFVDVHGDWEPTERYIPRKQVENGELKHFLDHYDGRRRTIEKTKADVEIAWKTAWEIGALAKVNAVFIDVEIEEKGRSLGPLSEMEESDLNGRLKPTVESPELMAKMASTGLERLLALRANVKTKSAQMLVVTGHDVHAGVSNPQLNKHAEAYREMLERVARARGQDRLRIEIATGVTKDGEPDKQSARRIKAFRVGHIDILIVKCMGVVGLDVPPCKVLIFGSTLRQGPLAVQSFSRALTSWDGCVAHVIMPKDIKMVELYERVVKEQGGECSESEMQLIDTMEIDPPDEREEWDFQNARVDTYGDETGDMRSGDYEGILAFFRSRHGFPVDLTDRQIIDLYLAGTLKLDASEMQEWKARNEHAKATGIRDLDEDLPTLRGRFGKRASKIVSKYIDYGAQHERWVEAVARLQGIAKRLCGIRSEIRVTKIDDAELLRRLIDDALPAAEQELFGDAKAA